MTGREAVSLPGKHHHQSVEEISRFGASQGDPQCNPEAQRERDEAAANRAWHTALGLTFQIEVSVPGFRV